MVEIIVPVHQVKYGAVTLLVPDEEANKLFGEDVPLQTAKKRIKKLDICRVTLISSIILDISNAQSHAERQPADLSLRVFLCAEKK